MKVKKRQQLSAITTKRLPSGFHITHRLWTRVKGPIPVRGSAGEIARIKKLGDLIAERKRLRRVKELGRKLEKAISGAARRGYTGTVGGKGSAFDDPRVKVLRRAYFRALRIEA